MRHHVWDLGFGLNEHGQMLYRCLEDSETPGLGLLKQSRVVWINGLGQNWWELVMEMRDSQGCCSKPEGGRELDNLTSTQDLIASDR